MVVDFSRMSIGFSEALGEKRADLADLQFFLLAEPHFLQASMALVLQVDWRVALVRSAGADI